MLILVHLTFLSSPQLLASMAATISTGSDLNSFSGDGNGFRAFLDLDGGCRMSLSDFDRRVITVVICGTASRGAGGDSGKP